MHRPLVRLSLLSLEERLTPTGLPPSITAPLPPFGPTLVSVPGNGTEANNVSGAPTVTPDGRYVAFWSIATNLVPGDTNARCDVFRRDMATGQVVRVSVAADGTQANGDTQLGIAISADGRYVAFSTWANNLAAGDTGGNPFDDTDIYRKDLLTGEVRLVSASAAGGVGDLESDHPQISADGRYVVFESKATNLVAGDTNGLPDIFRKDLDTGEVIRVSTATGGSQSNGSSHAAAYSADGRYVTFGSNASNLVPGDTNQHYDIFRKDLVTGQLVRVSVTASGVQGNGVSIVSAISADGRYVAFSSEATNLVTGDTNGVYDVYRKDVLTGQVVRVSVTAGGSQRSGNSKDPTLSADGRYVAFWSESPDLTTGGLIGLIDVYRKDVLTGQVVRVSVTAAGTQGDGQAFFPHMTADGQSVAFESSSRYLVPEDSTGGGSDIYLWGPVGPATVSVNENTTAVTTVTATDPDAGTTLTFSLAGGADAGLFAISPTTGVLTFVAAPDFEAPTDANADNVYVVTVQVSDGTLTATRALNVTVLSVPTLPFTHAFSPTPTGALDAYWLVRSGGYSVASGAAAGTATGANTAVVRSIAAANVAVSAVVKPSLGGLLATGLVARYTGTGDVGNPTANFYWGALNVQAVTDTRYTAQIWKIVNGVPQFINYNANQIPPAFVIGKTLRFEVFGSSLKLYLDDALLCFAVDTSLTAAGTVGVRTGRGSVLDDFAAVARVPVTPTLPFNDAFAAAPPRNTLSADWQERSGFFSVATGRAVGGSVGQPNVATLNGVSAANVTVTADFFFTAADQTAQLVGRYQGTNGTGDRNYYVATFTPQANGAALLRILKNVNGTVTELGRKSLAGFFPGGAVATPVTGFQFKLLGNQLSLRIGATTHLTVTDATFATGSVGIRSSKDVGVDNFAATAP